MFPPVGPVALGALLHGARLLTEAFLPRSWARGLIRGLSLFLALADFSSQASCSLRVKRREEQRWPASSCVYSLKCACTCTGRRRDSALSGRLFLCVAVSYAQLEKGHRGQDDFLQRREQRQGHRNVVVVCPEVSTFSCQVCFGLTCSGESGGNQSVHSRLFYTGPSRLYVTFNEHVFILL